MMLKAIAALSVMATAAMLGPAQARDVLFPGMPGAKNPPHGANGVFHGNYCGVGDNGPGLPPTDALDSACMHHDACTPRGGLPSCDCNARFEREIHAVAVSATEPDDLKAMATMVEDAIPVIPCR